MLSRKECRSLADNVTDSISLAQVIEKIKSQLVGAYTDVTAFLDSHAWLCEIASFARGWQDESLVGWSDRCGGIQNQLLRFRDWRDRLAIVRSYASSSNRVLCLDCREIHTMVNPRLKAISRDLDELLTSQLITKCNAFLGDVARCSGELSEYICMSHPTAEEYAIFVAGVTTARSRESQLKPLLDNIEELFVQRTRIDADGLDADGLGPDNATSAKLGDLQLELQSRWSEFQGMLQAGSQLAEVLAPMMTHKLNIAIAEQETLAKEILNELSGGIFILPTARPDRVLSKLRSIAERIYRVKGRQDSLRRALMIVSGRTSNVSAANTADKLVHLRQNAWQISSQLSTNMTEWLHTSFLAVDMSRLLRSLQDWKLAVSSLLWQLPNDDMLASILERIESFLKLENTLRMIASPIYQDHHWHILFAGLGRRWNPQKPFTLRTVLSMNLLRNIGLIEELHRQATAEDEAHNTMGKIMVYWKAAEFPFQLRAVPRLEITCPLQSLPSNLRWRALFIKLMNVKKKQNLKRGIGIVADLQEQTQQQQQLLQVHQLRQSFATSITSSHANNEVLVSCLGDCTNLVKNAHKHLTDLNAILSLHPDVLARIGTRASALKHNLIVTLEVIESWHRCQSLWLILNASLRSQQSNVGMAYLLSSFNFADVAYRELLETFNAHPLVWEALGRRFTYVGWRLLQGETLRRLLLRLHSDMEPLIVRLQDTVYNIRRRASPRLYFLTLKELAEFDFASNDPEKAWPWLRRCFSDVTHISVQTSAGHDRYIAVLHGLSGESLKLDTPVRVFPDQCWVEPLVEAMQSTMMRHLTRCMNEIEALQHFDAPTLKSLADSHLLQCLVVGLRVTWARRLNEALTHPDGVATGLAKVQVREAIG